MSVSLAVIVGVRVTVRVRLGVWLIDPVHDTVLVTLPVTESDGVELSVDDGVYVLEGVLVGRAVRVPVGVHVPVTLPDTVALLVLLSVRVADPVPE